MISVTAAPDEVIESEAVAPLRVVLADDHALVRAGIRALLADLVEKLHPNLVLMDIAMPGLNGLEASARVVKSSPATAVIILSMHSAQEYALQALRAGASGYVLKDADFAELELAIAAVARGETYLSPAMSRHLVADFRRRVKSALRRRNRVRDAAMASDRSVLS